ncbi:hypothetical protein MASR2M18_09980 [Ignavibacteria bacterium]|nr:CHASE2 domain-containing protein [Bacteroidota bacterium]MCZ2133715.1 CHASE2 domain-containing protein [Bacteroidota bacterium]
MLRRFFNTDSFFTLLLTFAAMQVLQLVALRVDFLNPLARSIADFHLTDVVFSGLRTVERTDTNIVLVNIAELNRAEIARQIRRITDVSPKVIGIDAFFLREKSPELDDNLAAALSNAPNVVLCSKIRYNAGSARFDAPIYSHQKFSHGKASGFANLINEDETDYKTVRKFSPVEQAGEKQELCFAAAIAKIADSAATARLLRRGNYLETINFTGNYGRFYTLDANTLLDDSADLSFAHNKIVVFGYLGRYLGQTDLTDRFFTPLNERPAGRTLPDMYGVVIHANIISMILREDYVNVIPDWSEITLNICMAYCFIVLFNWLYVYKSRWYDTVSVLVQLGLSLFLLLCQYLLFELYRFNLGLSLCVIIIALSGNVLEVYHDIIKNFVRNTHFFCKRKRSPDICNE